MNMLPRGLQCAGTLRFLPEHSEAVAVPYGPLPHQRVEQRHALDMPLEIGACLRGQMTPAEFARDLRPSQDIDGLRRVRRLSVRGLEEQILDDEDAAGLNRGEQGAKRDLLMVRRMACVVDDHIQLA